MSIAVLTQVYDEMRRLAIAGSVVAARGFPPQEADAPLEQAGDQGPVFAKVAEAGRRSSRAPSKTPRRPSSSSRRWSTPSSTRRARRALAGAKLPIETIDLGAPTTQASAGALKPLLEALSYTGSGRLEVIRDAHERGAFRDLRLIKPALDAHRRRLPGNRRLRRRAVLPLYGKAILPELRASFDTKGQAGHPRRLRLMHALDPVGCASSSSMRWMPAPRRSKSSPSNACGEPDDLSFLVEQATAKRMKFGKRPIMPWRRSMTMPR